MRKKSNYTLTNVEIRLRTTDCQNYLPNLKFFENIFINLLLTLNTNNSYCVFLLHFATCVKKFIIMLLKSYF